MGLAMSVRPATTPFSTPSRGGGGRGADLISTPVRGEVGAPSGGRCGLNEALGPLVGHATAHLCGHRWLEYEVVHRNSYSLVPDVMLPRKRERVDGAGAGGAGGGRRPASAVATLLAVHEGAIERLKASAQIVLFVPRGVHENIETKARA